MSNVLQILSENYSGQTVNITFQPLDGEVVKLTDVTLPYNFINDTFDGDYILFFPEYNLTHKLTIPNPGPPQSRCRCAEFSCFSLIGSPCKVSYLNCQGQQRNVSMISGQIFKDCVRLKSYNDKIKNITINLYNYCDRTSDCVELTPPPTNTQTPTNTPTNTQTPTNTPTPTNTTTPTNTPNIPFSPTPTPSLTPSFTPSNTPSNFVFKNYLVYFDTEGLKYYNIINNSSLFVDGYPQEEIYDGVAFDDYHLFVLDKTQSILKRYDIINFLPLEVDPSTVLSLQLPNLYWTGLISLVGQNQILISSQVIRVAYVIYNIVDGQAVEISRVSENNGENSSFALITETNPKKEIIFGQSFRQSVNYLEQNYYKEISGIYSVSQQFNNTLVGVFFYDWMDGNGQSINLVTSQGQILKINKSYPYNVTTIRDFSDLTIKSMSQIYGRLEYNTYFNPPIYLSGLTSNIVYSLSNNSLNLNQGTFISGLTYNKSLKNFNAIYKSVNVDGQPLPNIETKFKVVTYEDFTNNKYWRYWNNIIHLAVVSGYTNQNNFSPIDYNFNEIQNLELQNINNFNGVIKIKIDVSKFVWDLRSSDEHLFERVNEVVNKIELFPSISNLDFTIQCDVEYWSASTIFDTLTVTDYQNYYDNLGGIFTYSGHHIGIVWNFLSFAAGLTNSTGGFYVQIAGNSSFIVNTTEIWDTFVHEIGHALSLLHTFDCEWKDVYNELQFDYLDNTDDSTYGCLNCGYYTPYINEYIGTESQGCLAIMGYGKFDTDGCGSPNYVESSLDSESRLFNSYSNYTTFASNNDKNVTYFNFIDDNEININDLYYIEISIGNFGSNNLQNILDSIYLVSGIENEMVILSPRLSNPSTIEISLTNNEISEIFNYSQQSNFGIKLNREKINEGTTNWIINQIEISFYTYSGNNLISRKPKNYYTIFNQQIIKVPTLQTCRASRMNTFESNLVGTFTKFVSRSYFDL